MGIELADHDLPEALINKAVFPYLIGLQKPRGPVRRLSYDQDHTDDRWDNPVESESDPSSGPVEENDNEADCGDGIDDKYGKDAEELRQEEKAVLSEEDLGILEEEDGVAGGVDDV